MSRGIDGTFLKFHHHNTAEGKYWNPALDSFTAENWREKVREIAALKMEYIVVMATALYDRCYFESPFFRWRIFPAPTLSKRCSTRRTNAHKGFPRQRLLRRLDEAGVNITSSEVIDRSFKAMDELTEKYARHKSFYGWYFPDETCIILRFSGNFMKYVNLCSARCREITPDKKTLIAPYGTNLTLTNSKYIDALASLDVDFIAYQDEIGVKKTRVWQSERIFARLKKAHDKAGRAALWADIELFDFEGMVYKSALLPADFKRIERQIANVAPYADKIIGYQYIGLMNPEDSGSFAGHESSAELYRQYAEYLNK
mgnify:CR=1 FL=1